MAEERQRLDLALTGRGLIPSRERAKALIMAGQIYVNGQKELKAGRSVKETDLLEVRQDGVLPFVSRGGLKLQKALDAFGIGPEGLCCMDVGASTGGFTDCLLGRGARKVYAIDVGYGQLAWKLRQDARVVSLERTNFRYVTREQVPEEIDFASVDVSFISLGLIFPVLARLLAADGQAVCLVKPQFEAGRERVGKKGVVRDPAVHLDVLTQTIAAARQNGFFVRGVTFSPIKGPEGNIEYLLHLHRQAGEDDRVDPGGAVEEAHRTL
ncbi:MAG: TlyA family RNA methyltransferase [Oscillospiraceae bacterium]|jgi:23S rRNA (cytidine1920-2'-O)/16S rRNA (cytidine1409-2'-O)-methyltransferase|nr:TlyA family RNA methyltransferase [Oscillospiraceae bacterium]